MAFDKVNVREKLGLFSEYWSPKVISELNGQHGKVVKFLESSCGTTMTRKMKCSW